MNIITAWILWIEPLNQSVVLKLFLKAVAPSANGAICGPQHKEQVKAEVPEWRLEAWGHAHGASQSPALSSWLWPSPIYFSLWHSPWNLRVPREAVWETRPLSVCTPCNVLSSCCLPGLLNKQGGLISYHRVISISILWKLIQWPFVLENASGYQ